LKLSAGRRAIQASSLCEGLLRVSNVMSEFEIELLSRLGVSVIGAATGAENALNVMDEAMRQYRIDHIQIRSGTIIRSKRMGLYHPHCRNGRLSIPRKNDAGIACGIDANWRRQPFLDAL
jgi:hypothetical protein